MTVTRAHDYSVEGCSTRHSDVDAGKMGLSDRNQRILKCALAAIVIIALSVGLICGGYHMLAHACTWKADLMISAGAMIGLGVPATIFATRGIRINLNI
jgi:hypothetical protein